MYGGGGGVYKHRALRQGRCQIANFRTRSMKYKALSELDIRHQTIFLIVGLSPNVEKRKTN